MTRRRARKRLVRLLLVVLGTAILAPPAQAGHSASTHAGRAVTISAVDTSGYPEIRVTVVTPPGSGRPRLTENGVAVTGLQAANLAREKSVVLAVDRSLSMRGRSLDEAKAAAKAFVADKAPGDRIEVLAFGHGVETLDGFSTAPSDADSALAGVKVDGRSGTALWDTVVRAATALTHNPAPGHVIVLVTDGRDISSSASLREAIHAAEAARAAVYAVGIDSRDFTPGPLRQLASATGGRFVEASSTDKLTAIYRSIAKTLERTWQLRYVTSARPGDRLQLAVSTPGSGSATKTLSLAGAARATATPAQPSLAPASDWRSPASALVVSLAVGLLVLVALLVALGSSRADRLNTRLAPYLGRKGPRARRAGPRSRPSLLRRFFASTEAAFANIRQFRALQQLLTRADLPLLAAELLYLSLGVGVAAGILTLVMGAPVIFSLLVTCAAGAAPIAWTSAKARSRVKAFDNQLPDLLITIAASLKAGHSFRHAIQAVVDEGAEPAAKEFRRVLNETRLGRPMDDALGEMAERIGSKNLTFVLNAVTIQRQIGGSMAGLFEMVADTVRQRQQFARKIRGLTAMGRMSAYVLVALPVLLGLALTALNPAYMQPLWHTPSGHELLIVAVVMLGMGAVSLRKIVSFRG
ncbi:MAG TPA: VWA domain-containing protein [Gaiellaceae bacterium]|nr:VWA domain-containing protein [Gaiellaceae bacterium]